MLLLPVLAVVLPTAGCGYQWSGGLERQAGVFSSSLERVSIEGLKRFDPFRAALKRALHRYGVAVVAPASSQARIVVTEKHLGRQPLTITDDAKTREYLLIMTVGFSVSGDDGEELLAGRQVRAEASYLHNSERLAVSKSEERRISEDLYEDLARKIISRLQGINGG